MSEMFSTDVSRFAAHLWFLIVAFSAAEASPLKRPVPKTCACCCCRHCKSFHYVTGQTPVHLSALSSRLPGRHVAPVLAERAGQVSSVCRGGMKKLRRVRECVCVCCSFGAGELILQHRREEEEGEEEGGGS